MVDALASVLAHVVDDAEPVLGNAVTDRQLVYDHEDLAYDLASGRNVQHIVKPTLSEVNDVTCSPGGTQ